MKKIILFIASIFLILQLINAQTYKGSEAENIIPGADLIRYNSGTDIPQYLKFRDNNSVSYNEIFQWLQNFYDKSNNYFDFSLINQTVDKNGMVHYRYQQLYKGYPIEFTSYSFHVKNNQVFSMNGEAYGHVNLNADFTINEEIALNKALEFIDAEIYKWDISSTEQHLKTELKNSEATYFPKAEKVLIPTSVNKPTNNLRPAYKFDIYAHKPLMRSDVYVDAETGEIIFEHKKIHTTDVVGNAVTAYSGTNPITADSYGGSYRLRESGRGNGIETYDMNMGTDYGAAVDFTDTDNTWNNVNAELDQYATDAHWAAEMTYDYFYTIHSRNSIDGNGFALKSYIHFNLEDLGYPSNVNAFWDGYRMSYGDGNGTTISPLTTVDICGHEITHGLTTNTANLTYQDESGALNEGFSDIFGTMIEYYAKPSSANWTIGEDIGSTFRGLNNPNAYGLPDTYLGNNWATGTADNGGVHTNCGCLMYWFYLASEGGSGTNDNGDSYSVTGVGKSSVADIAFRMLTVYLTNSSNYNDARFYAIQSAVDLYGGCTPEVAAVTDAMYAIGVGNAYVPNTVSDFQADVTEACAAPFTVNFSNLSVNGNSFSWDFGDGGTSSNTNPSHTYTSTGIYTVSLYTDGGVCGTDNEIKTAYIEIDTTLPCISYMPSTGDYTHYACGGKLYDSGGPSSNYPDQSDVTFTIAPVGASQINLNIVSFDIEAGSGSSCDYDYVAFYDGPNTSSPLINNTLYCNTTGNPGTISSTGNSITIRLYSDQGSNNAGFEIDWSCVLPTTPPIANFNVSTTSTCNGQVSFNDLSTNGPMSWNWDFGDGNSSSDQNPSYTYTSNGTYTVTLTVMNNNGSDSYTETNYIVVNMPSPPTVVGDTTCENTSAILTANGAGSINWYDNNIGGNLVGSGSIFTTPTLISTTTFWAEDEISQTSQYVGETNNTSSGGFLAYEHYLVFDCTANATLVSVEVNAESAGNRTIELRDNNNSVLESTTINIPAGISRIDLNFDIPVANNLRLVCTGTPNLYRSNANTNYPYSISGLVSINNSSASTNPTGYYYYFYDWEIQEAACASARIPVEAIVVTCTGLENKTDVFSYNIYPNPANDLINITLNIPNQTKGMISIYDVNGQLITNLTSAFNPGKQNYTFPIKDLSSGVYYCKIFTLEQNITEQIIIIK